MPTAQAQVRQALVGIVLLALAGLAPPASAASVCTVSSGVLAFGAYQPLTMPGKLSSSAKTSTATLSVSCTGSSAGASYSIGIGPASPGLGDGISTRYMSNSSGGDSMAFNVYTDPTYLAVWGNGTIGTLVTRPVPASTESITVYGRIPGAQNTLRAGSYLAAMTVTITYNP